MIHPQFVSHFVRGYFSRVALNPFDFVLVPFAAQPRQPALLYGLLSRVI
jgi:hypothetical protein